MAYQANKSVVPRHRWSSLQMANRIPEVELEKKVREINRFRAYNMRERQVEERKLWDEMYDNDKVLKNSLARLPKQDVVNRMILVQKDVDDDKPLPFAEYYRQFIVFKAKRMAKIFGTTRERPPRYSELYYKELAPARNNRRNVDKLMKKTQEQQEESQKKLDILNDDSYQQQQQLLLQNEDDISHFPFNADDVTSDFLHGGRRPSMRTQHAKRHHRRDSRGHVTLARKDSYRSSDGRVDDATTEADRDPAFHLPSISDRFRAREDRTISKGLESADDGHVSPLPEVRRKTPILDIYKRRRRRKSSRSSSSDSDDD